MMNYFDFDTAKVAVCRSKCLTQFREKFTAREPWREYCAIKTCPLRHAIRKSIFHVGKNTYFTLIPQYFPLRTIRKYFHG
jgi:hypothetical protein